MIRRMCKLKGVVLLLVMAGIVLTLGAATQKPADVLIIQDELPQMKVLTSFLQERGGLSGPHDLFQLLLNDHRDIFFVSPKSL